jgi:putative FmdB family regulatory protein
MPIYEYKCEDCKRLTPAFVVTTNPPIKAECKWCGGDAEIILSAPGSIRMEPITNFGESYRKKFE